MANLVNSLSYNTTTKLFKLKLIYKYEAYGYMNYNAVDSQTFELNYDDIEYHSMLADSIYSYPSQRQTFLEFKKYHKINMFFRKYTKYFKPEENLIEHKYSDNSLEDVILLKIPKFSPKSPFPGYAVIPQKYSSIDYDAMKKYVKKFDFEEIQEDNSSKIIHGPDKSKDDKDKKK
jgi:hypothetical protein